MAAVRSENAAGWRSKRPSSVVPNTCDILTHGTTFCNRTCHPFLILGSWGGWRLPRRDTHTGINNCSHPHVVCLSMSSSLRCVQNHYNRPTLVSRKKTKNCGSVWSLVRSSEVGVPFHYALMPLKTDTRQKISGDSSCTLYQHDENTEAHSPYARTDRHIPSPAVRTPIIVTNQIKKCIQFYLHYRMLHIQYTQEQTKPTYDYV